MKPEQRRLLERFAAGETDDTGWAVNDAVTAALKLIDSLTTWTRAAPTVPGKYRYRYRFSPLTPWTEGWMPVTGPMGEDAVETQWCGPFPKPSEPCEEGGGA